MGPSEWIALASLIVTIFAASAGVISSQYSTKTEILDKIQTNKEELDHELQAARMSAYEEYKTLRQEMHEGANVSSREFGESLAAVREKVVQIELWLRDQLQQTRHTLAGGMDMRYTMLEEKLQKQAEQLRQLELSQARNGP